MKDNTVAMLQMRNPDLAGLSSRSAFSCSECSSVTIQTQFCLSPRSCFLLHENASKWEKEKKNGSRGKGKGGENLFRVTKEETNSNERDQKGLSMI